MRFPLSEIRRPSGGTSAGGFGKYAGMGITRENAGKKE